jgi:hypothetical protein
MIENKQDMTITTSNQTTAILLGGSEPTIFDLLKHGIPFIMLMI